MKILALDYGDKKIGVAKSAGQLAVPFGVLKNDDSFFSRLKEIIKEEEVEKIIVGIPKSISAEKSTQAQKVKKFIERLASEISIPIENEDETMSTKMAQTLIGAEKNKEDDSVAAMLILQSYLDKKH